MPDDLPPLFDPAEDCEERTPREILARHGYTPLSPDEVTDEQLPGRLWELLYAAARRFFFHQTNHLSDREFYTLLWKEWLDYPTADIPLEAETNTHLNLSEFNANGLTHVEIWLRFYAEEADRISLSPEENHSTARTPALRPRPPFAHPADSVRSPCRLVARRRRSWRRS